MLRARLARRFQLVFLSAVLRAEAGRALVTEGRVEAWRGDGAGAAGRGCVPGGAPSLPPRCVPGRVWKGPAEAGRAPWWARTYTS